MFRATKMVSLRGHVAHVVHARAAMPKLITYHISSSGAEPHADRGGRRVAAAEGLAALQQPGGILLGLIGVSFGICLQMDFMKVFT